MGFFRKLKKAISTPVTSAVNRVKNSASGKYDNEIKKLKKQLNTVNTQNRNLKKKIYGPLRLTEGYENWDSSSRYRDPSIVDPPTKNTSYPYVDPSDNLIQYDASSGLIKTKKAYNTLYKNYYKGYQYNESTIKNVLKPEIKYLKQTELTGFDFTFEALKNQNTVLENQIKKNITDYSTDNTKIAFQSEDLNRLKKINNILFGIYFIAVIALIYILFVVKKTLSIYLKIFIIAIAIIQPFVVDQENQLLKYIFKYFSAIIKGNVYVSTNYSK